MTLDLFTIQPGDIVHFRAGGSAPVRDVGNKSHDTVELFFGDEQASDGADWFVHGGWSYYGEHPMEIVDVKRTINWRSIKPGMAFKPFTIPDRRWATVWFLCVHPRMLNTVLVSCDPQLSCCSDSFSTWDMSGLKRAPEHDLAVPQ